MTTPKPDDRSNRRELLIKGTLVGAGVAILPGCPVDDDDDSAPTTDDCPDYARAFPNQDESEVRWGFLINIDKCRACSACSVACKTENDVRLGVFRNGVVEGEAGEYPNTRFQGIPWLCNHCEEPVCLDRCPTDPVKASLEMPNGDVVEYWARATYQRPDGLVLNDQERCVGCGWCVEDCPYGARFLDWSKTAGGNPSDHGLDIADPHPAGKCTMCVHRLENGIVPACSETCPADARLVGNLNDPNSAINAAIAAAGDRVSVLKESAGTGPKVFYVGLDEDIFDDGHDIRDSSGTRQYDVPGV